MTECRIVTEMLHHVKDGATVEEVSQEADVVTMGINPTRHSLHLGHYLTMLQAGKALHANPHAKGVFFVDNREHHHKLANSEGDDTFRLPNYRAANTVKDLMTSFMRRVSSELGDSDMMNRVCIQHMSDYMKDSSESNLDNSQNGSLLYSMLWNNRQAINALFDFTDSGSMQYVRPFCGDCKTSVSSDDNVRAGPVGILSTCLSQRCTTERLFIRPQLGEMNWSMHYTVDPIRDGLLTRQHHEGKVLHVFGGDYGIPWGIGNRPKASRMSELMDNIAPDMVDHFVGPMLTRDGHKLAKSNGDSHETPPVSVLQDLLSKNRSFIEIVA